MLTILKSGLYTTVQDNGRYLGAHLGIPISGPMDRRSSEISNLILGNHLNDALLECTFTGPILKFHAPTFIAITGAIIPVFINEIEIDTSEFIKIKSEDILSFGKIEKGCRFYIGIKGGINSKEIFNSKSTCITGGILQPIKKGDQLLFKACDSIPSSSISVKRTIGNSILSVNKGPEFSILNTDLQTKVFNSSFSVLPQSNRMAYRVKHAIDLSHLQSMLSSGTMPGTVQLIPSGEIICLMRDTQTTGGYPRILQLTEEAICNLSQLCPNEEFSFQLI